MKNQSINTHQLIGEWNNTATCYPESLCIHHLFEERAKEIPDEIAVMFDDQQLTYKELNSCANQLAHYLISLGVEAETFVCICIERSIEMVISVLAVLKAGGAYVPLDPEYPKDRLEFMVEDTHAPILLTQQKLTHIFHVQNIEKICLDTQWKVIAGQKVENPESNVQPDNIAYVIYTSGSTGKPKGVAMPHRPLVNLISWQLKNSKVGRKAKTLQFAPLSFDVSFQELFSTWCAGGILMLVDDELRLNSVRLMRFIQNHSIERLFLPFIALQHLAEVVENNNLIPDTLREVITAGEQLQINQYIINFFNKAKKCRLYNQYGPSEAHVVTAFELNDQPDKWPALPPIGKPIANTRIYIVDKEMNLVLAGETGELCIGGICIARGYLNRPELTSQKFVRDPFGDQLDARIYKTGDLALYQSDGNIQFLGRMDGQVKIRGYRIELGEIEVTLSKHPLVKQAIVLAREDEPGDKRLVAYLSCREGSQVSITELRRFLENIMPDYMVPATFVIIDNMPKTPSGKVDRLALPKPGNKRPELDQLYVAPQNEFEKRFAKVWSKLLKIDRVGIHDSFFDLGGNSLLAIQATEQLRKNFGIELSIVKLFQYPTVNELVKYLQKGQTQITAFEKAYNRIQLQNAKKHPNREDESTVAIIGMSGRFPNTENLEDFWQKLCAGTELITFFSDEELDPAIPDYIKNDPYYVKARGVIKNVDQFDAAFFGFTSREAEIMDPQQRVFLEVAWNALETAGYVPETYSGLIGLYAGMSNNTYFPNNVAGRQDLCETIGDFQTMLINEKDYIATHAAHKLSLTGPCVSVQTACSTSLVAVCEAYNSLKNYQCDIALAGAATVTSPVKSGYIYQEGGMYSTDGHTRPFDEAGTGTVFSDGVGVVVLKRLTDAIADGDNIIALIKGAALNNDGANKVSFTAPSVDGQAAVIAMAQANAGVDPQSISYIEAHGTATPLGDPIELEALTQVFRHYTSEKAVCAIGSIKSNLGHLNTASGVTGLIKTALSLKHQLIPPTINFKRPNTRTGLADSPFYVNTKLMNWPANGSVRRAGVSSFGVGGTNAHIVLEEFPEAKTTISPRPKYLLVFSAKSEKSLHKAVSNLGKHLCQITNENIADVAFTLQVGRKAFNHRGILVCDDNTDASNVLTSLDTKRIKFRQLDRQKPPLVFMFPGQGTQYVNMGMNLYKTEPVFKETVDQCAEIIQPLLGKDLRQLLYPGRSSSTDDADILKKTLYTQPAIFTIEYALSKLWQSWGIYPDAMIGHSIGEFVAGCLAGVFSLEDALTLVTTRGQLTYELPGGSMLSVRMPAEILEKILNKDMSIAAINGPSLSVVSGPSKAIEALEKELETEGIVCRHLHTSHAFHSPMMDPIVQPFVDQVKKISLAAPDIPIVSSVTADWMTEEQATDPMYWGQHMRKPVRFAEGIQLLWQNKERVLLEVGPRMTAATLAKQQAKDKKKQIAISSLGETAANDAEWSVILNALGLLWLAGVPVDFQKVYAHEKRRRVVLPTYPFEYQRYWIEPDITPPPKANGAHAMVNFDTTRMKDQLDKSNMRQNNVQQAEAMASRKMKIMATLKDIFEEISGEGIESDETSISFLELGFDSLFLTQASMMLKKKFKVKVSFRQLLDDYSSFDALADFIDETLPPDVYKEVSSHANTIVPDTVNPMGINMNMTSEQALNIENVISQQLQLMSRQLEMLSGSSDLSFQRLPTHQQTMTQIKKSIDARQKAVCASKFDRQKTTKTPTKAFGAAARIETSTGLSLTEKQKDYLEKFIESYTKQTKGSKTFSQEHRFRNADPRVVTGFNPLLKELVYPIVVNRSHGSRIWDVDGNEYIDMIQSFGASLFGYSPKFITEAINQQIKKGYEIGPQHVLVGEVAQLMSELTGHQRVAFCNTGSEAVLGAMRIARTVTGRDKIVIFTNSYHGINDEVIVRGTKSLRSIPAAAGILPSAVENVLVLDYDSADSIDLIKSRIDEFAAIMVEPVQSRNLDLQPKAFLYELRRLTENNETALIFDEVITGFRSHLGGAQAYFGIHADLATYGKIVGGGLPVGMIAGKREYMDALDGGSWQFGDDSVPEIGVTYFAGTFVRHPLVLAAAKASLLFLKEQGPSLQETLNNKMAECVRELRKFLKELEVPISIKHFSSAFRVIFKEDHPCNALLYYLIRLKGIHMLEGFTWFLTTAHTDKDIEHLIKVFKETIVELVENGFIKTDAANNEDQKNTYITSAAKSMDSFLLPPVPGAKLGKDVSGNPGWFVPDPDRPGKYLQVGDKHAKSE